jgi:L-ascorbate metabolism protein UlaG (beta-lactamase superfamily)
MRRFLPALALLLAVSILPAQSKPAAEIKIAWYGQSMFEIVTPKGTRIVIDPHNLEEYRIKPMKADLVLMSHFHVDHSRTEMIENIKEIKAINALKQVGLNTTWNVVDEKFKDVHIKTVATYHDSSSGLVRGKNGVWVIDVDKIRIVHLGDLGHQLDKRQLNAIGTVDVLMVPVGGVYTLNGIDAQKVVEQIKPRRWVLPMHCATAVYSDLLPPKYFLDEQPQGTEIKKFKPNQYLSIDPKAPLPKRYSVAMLYWAGFPHLKVKGKDKDKGKPADK